MAGTDKKNSQSFLNCVEQLGLFSVACSVRISIELSC